MPKYLPAELVRAAAERLGHSAAKNGLCDFLILKRTMQIDGSAGANTSSLHVSFQRAIYELMACYPVDLEELLEAYPRPFINVFGTAEHSTRGYRSGRYLTNGTASTVKNWSDVILIEQTDPMIFAMRDDYLDGLERRVLKGTGAPMRLQDAAAWYHRYTDVEEIVGDQAVSEGLPRLADEFVSDFGLGGAELTLLFPSDD